MTPQQEKLTFRLPIFEGPLDLLLYLIRAQEVDIRDIPIMQITQQYLDLIQFMKELNLDVAGEYLLMASTLVHIKSRMLLPRPSDQDADAVEDPREALVQKLLEYERFKKAAEMLYERGSIESASFPRGEQPQPEPVTTDAGEILIEASLFDLVGMFRKILQAQRDIPIFEVHQYRFSIREQAERILKACLERKEVPLTDFLTHQGVREEIIVTFLALLELVRLGAVKAYQSRVFGEIFLRSTGRAVDLLAIEDDQKPEQEKEAKETQP